MFYVKMLPYFWPDDTTLTNSQMKIHYLEWSSHQVTADSTFTDWPSSQSAVSVVNDQSSFGEYYLPDFKQDLDSSNPGTITKTIPGQLVFDELTEYYSEVYAMNPVR